MAAHRLAKLVAWALVLLAVGRAAVVTAPLLRHYLVAILNDPKDLPALETDPRVHFEPSARRCAQAVAELLPSALARIEEAQGRPFAAAPTIGVYASKDAYAKANGLEDPTIAATSRSGRVLLSPRLCDKEFDRLGAVLTHELSHAHLFGWRFAPFRRRPPSWFTEGLAVMVSGGGGAEGLSDAAASDAIVKGYAIVVGNEGLWLELDAIPFELSPPRDPFSPHQRLAYRQAAMFVAWLRDRDPQAFDRLLQGVENGENFADAFQASYASGPAEQWRKFASALSAGTLGPRLRWAYPQSLR